MKVHFSAMRLGRAMGSRSFSGLLLLLGLATLAVEPALSEQANPDDQRWDSGFTLATGEARATAFFKGEIYAGGGFSEFAGVPANGIARQHGKRWMAVGGGLDGPVNALCPVGDRLYVGGEFHRAGETKANYIAIWDGKDWSALGKEPEGGLGAVKCIVASENGTILVAESSAYGLTKEARVLRWDGKNWASVGQPVQVGAVCRIESIAANRRGSIFALVYYEGGTQGWGREIQQWNGTAWVPFPKQLGSGLHAIALSEDGTLYAGGEFNRPWSLGLKGVVQWNSNEWQNVGGGLDGYAAALATDGNSLFVGGNFRKAGELTANGIAMWNGKQWQAFGIGFHGGGIMYATSATNCVARDTTSVRRLVVSGPEIFATGNFVRAGNAGANRLAKWDGQRWHGLAGTGNNGVNGEVVSLAVAGGSVYAGGKFTVAGSVGASGVARWDGASWQATEAPFPLDGEHVVATHDRNLYVGGSVGPAGYVAQFDGKSWSRLEQQFWVSPNVIAAHGNQLFVGDSGIKRWDGAKWDSLSTGRELNSGTTVAAVAVSDRGEVYVAGKFENIGGVPAANIAMWDGERWRSLGNGIKLDYGAVRSIALRGNKLYAAGDMIGAGNEKVNGIAVWDGEKWSALGGGLTYDRPSGNYQPVKAIIFDGDDLYVGGDFSRAGGIMTRGIAKWDGKTWSALGSGLGVGDGHRIGTGRASALAIQGGYLYIGGRFDSAGGKAASNFSRWRLR